MNSLLIIPSVVLFISLIRPLDALFEDQIGKFDWRRQFVGEIVWAELEGRWLFVSTKENVIAQLDTHTSQIGWRQVLEDVELTNKEAPRMVVTHKGVLSLSPSGQHLRCWEESTGALKWEVLLSENTVTYANTDLLSIDQSTAVVRVGSELFGLDLKTGQKKWTFTHDRPGSYLPLVSSSDLIYLVSYQPSKIVSLLKINANNGAKVMEKNINADWFQQQMCTTVGPTLVCLCDYGTNLATVDLTAQELSAVKTDVDASNIKDLKHSKYFAVVNRRGDKWTIFAADSQSPNKIAELSQVTAAQIVSDSGGMEYLVASSIDKPNAKQSISWYEIPSGKVINEWKTETTLSQEIVTFERIFASLKGQRQVLAVGQDHGASMFDNKLVWTRQEALASALSVEMVALPLSEAQANIETEFKPNEDLVTMLSRRLSSQVSQIRRALITAAEEVLSLTALIGHQGVIELLDIVREQKQHRTTNTPISASGDAFERDYFDLHKVIVVVTAPGKVFGLDNRKGAILWQMWLEELDPFGTDDGVQHIPLFVQRTTAHYPHPAQCALVAKSKTGEKTVLVAFDPMSGKVVEEKKFSILAEQVVLTPYLNDKDIQGVLVTTREKAFLYPSDVTVPDTLPTYLMFPDESQSMFKGYRLLAETGGSAKLSLVWQTPLPLGTGYKILHMNAKALSEHVHSQGRVLGDRSVLYKYVNPNLIAIVAIQEESPQQKLALAMGGQLSIYLIDAVTGQVVYHAKHLRAAGPVHMVHCENWITYSYWNEKARRTEMNVLEMYEGGVQTDPEKFSSLAPNLNPPTVLSQAYIFPQGVSAIGVTNTERGLANRLLLIAMPFGGILEMPKALLDPRRPLIPTMEHKEEGLIPYIPELPVATEQIVNYNQTVVRVRHISTAASGLESTSLALAYGLDMFFTRLTPSGTFDILKDDFDHWFIAAVLSALFLGSVITKKLARHRDLKQAWK